MLRGARACSGRDCGADEPGGGSERLAQAGLELMAKAAAELEARVVLEDDDVVAVRMRVQLFDALDVDEARTVDAYETVGVELRLQLRERGAVQVLAPASVKLHVDACRLDPVHVARRQEEHAAAGLDEQPFEVARGRGLCWGGERLGRARFAGARQQREQSGAQLLAPLRADVGEGARE